MNAPAEVTLRSRIASLREGGSPLDVAHAIGLIVPLAVELGGQHEQGYNFFLYPSGLFEGQDGQFHASAKSAEAPTEPADLACLPPESNGTRPGGSRQSVYGIGAILYELITLQSAGEGMRRPSELVPGIPQSLEMILMKALVGDPEHRPDDLGALAQALYQINSTHSIAPPPADVSHLDHDGDFDIDVSMSLMPPAPSGGAQVVQGMQVDAPLPPGVGASGTAAILSGQSGGHEDLLAIKARLEADRSPRYVVVKGGMDHGPFAAVELLQQIASHTFEEDDIVRDSVAGSEGSIKEHPDFHHFARHARMGRHEKAEKEAVVAAVAQESRHTAGKAVVALGIVAALGIAIGGWFLAKRATRNDEVVVVEEKTTTVESDQQMKVAKKSGGRRRGGVVGKTGGFPQLGGGMSCEAAQAAYVEEMKMDGSGQADLTVGQFAGVLNTGSYLNACGVPETMGVSICAAVQNGRAVGVTVRTTPHSGAKAGCISGQVRRLSFPSHPKLDIARTQFAAQ